MDGLIPRPDRSRGHQSAEWSEEWQAAFQAAVLPFQSSIEDAYALMAKGNGAGLLVCDRGILDGAAYTPGGVDEFCRRYGVDAGEAAGRYAAIIHLESLATAAPEKYGQGGNANRFEPLERAQELECSTRAAWESHPRRVLIEGRPGIEAKVAEVIGIVRYLLATT